MLKSKYTKQLYVEIQVDQKKNENSMTTLFGTRYD